MSECWFGDASNNSFCMQLFCHVNNLKAHFVIHSLIPLFFSKKIEIFVPVEAFRYILFVLKIFLANLLVWRSNRRICVFFMSTWKFQHIVANATVWYSKTRITHKHNLRINWKFGNKLISSISIDLCYKNSMLGSQNGPLSNRIRTTHL